MANKANLEATLAAIEANPEHWDQDVWHCGTSHCFAGFAEMLRLGMKPTEECQVAPVRVRYSGERYLEDEDATRQWLGLNEWEWDAITDDDNSLNDIRLMIKNGIPGDDYDDED